MKLAKATFTLSMILLGIIASGSALAHHGHRGHHGHVRFGVFVGVQAFWYYPPPYYYYSPYYYPPYYPPAVAVPSSPPVYIEQGSAQPAPAQPQGYWYYCAEANAYYPYVRQCAGVWQRVVPQPPPG